MHRIDTIENGKLIEQQIFNAIDVEYNIIEGIDYLLINGNISCYRTNDPLDFVRIGNALFIKTNYNIIIGKDKFKGTILKGGKHNITVFIFPLGNNRSLQFYCTPYD